MQNATSTEEELDTPSELARALKVSQPTVMAYFRRGIIPAEVAIGRVFRFNRAKCLAALAAHREAEAPSKGKRGNA